MPTKPRDSNKQYNCCMDPLVDLYDRLRYFSDKDAYPDVMTAINCVALFDALAEDVAGAEQFCNFVEEACPRLKIQYFLMEFVRGSRPTHGNIVN